MRPGPITSTCFPPDQAEPVGLQVRAYLPPVRGAKRAQRVVDERLEADDEGGARSLFAQTLREIGTELWSIGLGEVYPPDRFGYEPINWLIFLSGKELTAALERLGVA